MRNLELRMYGLVPYNLSPIQQGIQFMHASVEYGLENFQSEQYQDWAKNWKTVMILNGGTTNNGFSDNTGLYNEPNLGTLNKAYWELYNNGITVSTFNEPDLGNQLTSVVFIVDERCFNREKYPDYTSDGTLFDKLSYGSGIFQYEQWLEKFSDTEENVKKILFLRSFLTKFRLA